MKTARIVRLVAVCCVLSSPLAFAQRVQFATPVAQTTPPSSAVVGPPGTGYVAQPGPQPYPPPATAPFTAPATLPPSVAAPAAPTYGVPAPTYSPQPGYAAPPTLAPGAAVQPPPANWDPYATPGCAPSALLPQDPYFQSSPSLNVATVQKFLQHIDLDYHWFAGHNGQTRHEELGINDIELSATFAFPLFFNSQTPLLVSPGFAVHYWEGPLSIPPPAPTADLPPRTYDAYIDAAWNPQLTDYFSGELEARIGVYSDFDRVAGDSIRVTGKGLAVVKLSPSVKLKAGVEYLNRNVIKILPAGGICWSPNPDVYFDILFPTPKIGKRLTTWGNTDWWVYASGDYGGGKWAIHRENGTFDTFDYNDIRVAIGLEFHTLRQLHGYFEAGGAFNREVVYQSTLPPGYFPNDTVFLRAGLSY